MLKVEIESEQATFSDVAQAVNAAIVESLKGLSDDARLDLFQRFAAAYCMHCGSENPNCQCWNDE